MLFIVSSVPVVLMLCIAIVCCTLVVVMLYIVFSTLVVPNALYIGPGVPVLANGVARPLCCL